MALDCMTVYDALYTLAADGGCEELLFGDTAPLAHEAFRRSLAGDGYPTVWFELPLSGRPRFDLHVAIPREALHAGVRFPTGSLNGYDELFRWYAEEERGGNGLAFAYDVGEGRIDDPAVHVNVNKAPLSDMSRFFDLAAGNDAADCYAGFVRCLPRGWHVWYAGVHPGRPGSPVRVDCFVDAAVETAYRADVALLEHDVRACGFEAIEPGFRSLVAPILESPFGLELQFDVMRDGSLGPTLGVSAAFDINSAATVRAQFGEDGPAAELLDRVERLGLADERWRHIPDASFSNLVHLDDKALALFCSPTFVKLRLRDGEPLDAKAYLQAGAFVLGG